MLLFSTKNHCSVAQAISYQSSQYATTVLVNRVEIPPLLQVGQGVHIFPEQLPYDETQRLDNLRFAKVGSNPEDAWNVCYGWSPLW
mmetsp:Transcript_122792/g.223162  ORF Transcript_122792/g.223162 Transcript_122792/m.223162 type:complete len:86 (+) Transcript_122792:74-331(+)